MATVKLSLVLSGQTRTTKRKECGGSITPGSDVRSSRTTLHPLEDITMGTSGVPGIPATKL